MTKRRASGALFSLLCLGAALPHALLAEPLTTQDCYERSQAVLEGEVEGQELGWTGEPRLDPRSPEVRFYHLAVRRVWKGEVPEALSLRGPESGGARPFLAGGRILFYLRKNPDESYSVDPWCGTEEATRDSLATDLADLQGYLATRSEESASEWRQEEEAQSRDSDRDFLRSLTR